jgi:hypothetical protein
MHPLYQHQDTITHLKLIGRPFCASTHISLTIREPWTLGEMSHSPYVITLAWGIMQRQAGSLFFGLRVIFIKQIKEFPDYYNCAQIIDTANYVCGTKHQNMT